MFPIQYHQVFPRRTTAFSYKRKDRKSQSDNKSKRIEPTKIIIPTSKNRKLPKTYTSLTLMKIFGSTFFAFCSSLLHISMTAGCVYPSNRRDLLNLGGLRRLDNVVFNDTMVSNCMSLDYTVNLLILEHLYFFFQAGPEAQDNGCDSILIHSQSTHTTNATMSKEAVVVPTKTASLVLRNLDTIQLNMERLSLKHTLFMIS